MAGFRFDGDGTLGSPGALGYYWSSGVASIYSSNMYFNSGDAFMNADARARGLSVRCIKN
jgi:hypothetical protein